MFWGVLGLSVVFVAFRGDGSDCHFDLSLILIFIQVFGFDFIRFDVFFRVEWIRFSCPRRVGSRENENINVTTAHKAKQESMECRFFHIFKIKTWRHYEPIWWLTAALAIG